MPKTQTLWHHPVTDLRPGDVIKESILVTGVSIRDDDLAGWIRIEGQIIKGSGRSRKIRSWSYAPDQTVDVER